MIARVFLGVGVLSIALLLTGCHKSDSDSSSGSSSGSGGGGASGVSGIQKDAQDAVLAEIARHWEKKPEGWVTARNSGTDFAPLKFVRQMREISPDGVESFDLTDSDKLNGFEWSGSVSFKKSACREAGDIGYVLDGLADITVQRLKGHWSQWIDFQPEAVHVQKHKGQWQFTQDTWMLRGTIPTPMDYQQAGVK